MASLGELKAAAAREDDGAVITIYQKGSSEPYLANDGSPATVTVIGSESPRYKAARRRAMRVAGRRGPMAPEEAEKHIVEQLAAAVIDWHGWEDEDGHALPCTPENVCKLLAWEHIYEQVYAAIHGSSAFFAGASTRS